MKKYLFALLFLKAIILAILISNGYIGLAPDEAQYWTWSQELDWGYYSKPPGIAWQIAGTTFLFGNTLFGIRIGALIIGILLSLVIYQGAKLANLTQKASCWAAITFAASPLGFYLSIAATTDGGSILFLTAAIVTIIGGAQSEKGPNYWLSGFLIGLAALYKWTAFLFWPVTLIFFIFYKNFRKWSLLGGILISLLALLPTIYWNFFHEWATFRHVGATIGKAHSGNFLDFLGAQMALISPIFFILLIFGLWAAWREGDRRLFLAAAFPTLVGGYLMLSIFKKMQPNWADHLYPAGFILIVWFAYYKMDWGKFWLHIGTYFSLFMIGLLFAIPCLQSSGIPIPYKLNPFRQSMGWSALPTVLEKAGYQTEADFLFGDKYQTASILSFYGPQKKRAYFFNLGQSRKNQFSFWPQMDPQELGHTGYFVVFENLEDPHQESYISHYRPKLESYFESVSFLGAYPLFSIGNKPVKFALIFKCHSYLGKLPPEPSKY